MAKRCKKKTGLHKKVSTVFKGVSIPQHENDQQNSQTHPPDGPGGSPSTSRPTGSLVSKSFLIKKVCRSKSPSNKATTGRKKTLLSKRKTSDRSALKESPVLQEADNERDEPTLDHTIDVPPKRMALDHLTPQRTKRKNSPKAKDPSGKARPVRTVKVPPRLTAPDEPIPQREPVKELPQNENPLDNAEPDRTVEAPLKQPLPELSLPPHPPAEDTLQTKEPSDDIAPDRTVDVPSWMMSPDYPDSRWNSMNGPTPSEDSSSRDEPDDLDEEARTDGDEWMPQHASAEEPPQAENVSDKVTSRKKRWVPPKLTIQDHAMSQDSSTRKPEQAENARDKAVPDRMNNAATQSAPWKQLHQAEETTETSTPDPMTEASPISKSEKSQLTQDFNSEKRYGPEAPPKKAVSTGQQHIATALPKASGPSLWQQINNKLFAPKPGTSPTKQKVMVISIPILAITMIFLFRQVLSKSPGKTKGASPKDIALVAPADANQEIDWQIPEPLPATMRDPTILPAESNTQNGEQDPPAVATKSELIINIGTIVYSHDKSSAVVNGRIVHIGDKVSGVTVLKINRDSVEFEKDGEKWVQKIHD